MAKTIEVSAHFDGEHIVPDEPLDVPVGTSLRIIVESNEERKGRLLAALRALGNLEGGEPRLGDKYLDDREGYYYADSVHTGIDHDPNDPS